MSATIIEFKRPATNANSAVEEEPPRHDPAKPYSFDIYQAHPGDMVSIDACVPMAVALAMLEMLKAIA